MFESQTSVELPILDISQPLQPSAGFFLISNHGISRDLYRRLYMISRKLFDLPFDAKLELGPSSSTNTYTPHFIASPFFESLRVSGPNFFASANFENKYYESEFKNCHGYLRIINCSPPEALENEVEGLGMHTDMSCITIVYQDEIGGLQVRSKEGKLKCLEIKYFVAKWCFKTSNSEYQADMEKIFNNKCKKLALRNLAICDSPF
ncbi:hypothetical protein CUMW_064880, partial [Citrus unshiu]